MLGRLEELAVPGLQLAHRATLPPTIPVRGAAAY
jgi:hypothetical protein